jgi:hypothetical protein
MSDLTMPALHTVLVGDDPVRRVATQRRHGDWHIWTKSDGWWHYYASQIHDVRPLIPEGTPVERIVGLPRTNTPQWMSDGHGWTMGGGVFFRGPGMTAEQARDEADEYLTDAADLLALARAIAARVAARAAETTPNPLAQVRERLYRSVDWDHSGATVEVSKSDLAAVVHPPLAATEGGVS